MDTSNQYEQVLKRFAPNGVPDRDAIQKTLTEEFILGLLLRCDSSVEQVVEAFGRQYRGQLDYLGDQRQDRMLHDAMVSTGIDLSRYITTKEEQMTTLQLWFQQHKDELFTIHGEVPYTPSQAGKYLLFAMNRFELLASLHPVHMETLRLLDSAGEILFLSAFLDEFYQDRLQEMTTPLGLSAEQIETVVLARYQKRIVLHAVDRKAELLAMQEALDAL